MPEKKKREYERVCAVCGKAFTAGAPNAKYCSDACRNEARRERDRERRAREKEAAKEGGALLFPGVVPEKPRDKEAPEERRAEEKPVTRKTAEAPAAREAARKNAELPAAPVPKGRLTGFKRPAPAEEERLKAGAAAVFRGRAAAWASVFLLGALFLPCAVLTWGESVAGVSVSCLLLSLLLFLSGASGAARCVSCLRKIKRGRFKAVKCEVSERLPFGKAESSDVLVRTEAGQECRDVFRADLRGGGLALVKCVLRSGAAYALVSIER